MWTVTKTWKTKSYESSEILGTNQTYVTGPMPTGKIRVWVNAVQLNAVLNGVHLWLNAELNDLQFSELNAELNAVQIFCWTQIERSAPALSVRLNVFFQKFIRVHQNFIKFRQHSVEVLAKKQTNWFVFAKIRWHFATIRTMRRNFPKYCQILQHLSLDRCKRVPML